MSTPDDTPVGSDPQEDEADCTICPTCGENLPHHLCGRSEADAQ